MEFKLKFYLLLKTFFFLQETANHINYFIIAVTFFEMSTHVHTYVCMYRTYVYQLSCNIVFYLIFKLALH